MKPTILVIAKDTTELRRLREILTREGYSIMTAMDRDTADQICKRIPIDFILGDAVLSGFVPSELKAEQSVKAL
jgi:PleD family two-component response regulator